jgi:hypothetical protein
MAFYSRPMIEICGNGSVVYAFEDEKCIADLQIRELLG